MQSFEGGFIYYKWGTYNAYEVDGWIWTKWYWGFGEVTSPLGYPTANPAAYPITGYPNAQRSVFENGYIIWDGQTGQGWQGNTYPVLTAAVYQNNDHYLYAWVDSFNSDGSAFVNFYGDGFPANSSVKIYRNVDGHNTYVGTWSTNSSGVVQGWRNFHQYIYPGDPASDCGYVTTNKCIVTLEARSPGSGTPTDFAVAGVNIHH